MLQKIVVIGSESTGKSTLSKALAQQLKTSWVEEYAREYLEANGNNYCYDDLRLIAEGQIEREDKKEAKRHLICDTDLYVLKVWSEHRFGKTCDYILQEIARRKYDAYILCNIDLPWCADPQREHPQPEMRSYFYNIYKDIVQQSGVPFIIASGNDEERLETAIQFVQYL